MRYDMSKVIVERPRVGGDGGNSDDPKGYKKKLDKALKNALDDDQTWDRESTSRHRKHGWNAKEFSERLGPLRKFLRSKVGQPWNDVWSEICKNLRNDNVVQNHVRDHVGWDVEQEVVMVDGKPMHATKDYGIYSPFYVHPDTGILCETEKGKRRHWNGYPKKFVPGKDEMHQYHVINGVWYEIELADFPPRTKNRWGNWNGDTVNDIILCRRKDAFFHYGFGGASRSECKNLYGREVYGIRKHQLSGKEIKKLKLWETDVGVRARQETENKAA